MKQQLDDTGSSCIRMSPLKRCPLVFLVKKTQPLGLKDCNPVVGTKHLELESYFEVFMFTSSAVVKGSCNSRAHAFGDSAMRPFGQSLVSLLEFVCCLLDFFW